MLLLVVLSSCRQNSDITTVDDDLISITEHFDFNLNGQMFSIDDLSGWIEDHDSVEVTQLVNFGTGDLPQFIFNIHGTEQGVFQRADLTITLDENIHDPDFFKCSGCTVESNIEYFGDKGDFIIGTFEGQIPAEDGTWYPIMGSFAAIREN